MTRRKLALFDRALLGPALLDSLRKLDPRVQWRNPVMFVVYIGSILTTALWVQAITARGEAPAEGRSKAQAESLRGLKQTVFAKRLDDPAQRTRSTQVRADALRRNDVVLIEAGDYVPADGEVIAGAASVDESAITGESAPVIREAGGDFSAVTGGTRVLSDWIVVRVTVNPGETFLDRMIAMVE